RDWSSDVCSSDLFVKEPKFLKENNNVDNDLVVSKIDEFKGISAIHFSNGGGVYSANIHDEKIILKEGRSTPQKLVDFFQNLPQSFLFSTFFNKKTSKNTVISAFI